MQISVNGQESACSVAPVMLVQSRDQITPETEVAMPYLLRCAAGLLLLLAGPVLAQTADEAAISELLHTTFDRPEAPLTIAPVVVAGSHAIAGWAQAEMGGGAVDEPVLQLRAFLVLLHLVWLAKHQRGSTSEYSREQG
jgi:hypothetical protein